MSNTRNSFPREKRKTPTNRPFKIPGKIGEIIESLLDANGLRRDPSQNGLYRPAHNNLQDKSILRRTSSQESNNFNPNDQEFPQHKSQSISNMVRLKFMKTTNELSDLCLVKLIRSPSYTSGESENRSSAATFLNSTTRETQKTLDLKLSLCLTLELPAVFSITELSVIIVSFNIQKLCKSVINIENYTGQLFSCSNWLVLPSAMTPMDRMLFP